MPSDPRLREAMERAAAAIVAPTSLDEALFALTRAAAHAVPGADRASISIRWHDGRLETVAATDPRIDRLDALQYELREGPCYAAITAQTLLVSDDLARDPQWPRYGPAAADAGVRAQMAVLLTDDGAGRTALNVYAARPHVFGPDSVELAEVCASHVAVALDVVRTVGSLSQAVAYRQVVGQATGMLMDRYEVGSERAFALLARISEDSDVQLRDVAAHIVEAHNGRTREDPTLPRRV